MTPGEYFAFVPARGGSQGVRGKNWRELSGVPLIKWTLDFALSSKRIERVVLSTDSPEICEIGSEGKLRSAKFSSLDEDAIVQVSEKCFVHKRKIEQAGTYSLISEVLFDFTRNYRLNEEFDELLLLQPTSPFRYLEEFESLLDLSKSQDEWSSVVSVKNVGGMHPDRMYKLSSNWAAPFLDQSLGDNRPRQLLESLFIKDGAYYLLRTENLFKRVLLGNKILAFVRSGLRTVNIDTEEDFAYAEYAALALQETGV
jgi:CMP-N,N'-diacetyllegionaminic acid synthase